jgi:hypothetical protein
MTSDERRFVRRQQLAALWTYVGSVGVMLIAFGAPDGLPGGRWIVGALSAFVVGMLLWQLFTPWPIKQEPRDADPNCPPRPPASHDPGRS